MNTDIRTQYQEAHRLLRSIYKFEQWLTARPLDADYLAVLQSTRLLLNDLPIYAINAAAQSLR